MSFPEQFPGLSGVAAPGPVPRPEEKWKKTSSFFKKQSKSSMGCSGDTLSEEESIKIFFFFAIQKSIQHRWQHCNMLQGL